MFPDQLRGLVKSDDRRKREADKLITSRDDPLVNFESRFQNEDVNASYIPYNNVPMGVTHYKGRLFVTMPRRRIGIPSTLNYIDLQKDGKHHSPKLYAYPDFETNYLNVSVTFHIRSDYCILYLYAFIFYFSQIFKQTPDASFPFTALRWTHANACGLSILACLSIPVSLNFNLVILLKDFCIVL